MYLGECPMLDPMLKGFAAGACLCAMAVAEAEPYPLSGQELHDLVAGATVEIDTPLPASGGSSPTRSVTNGRSGSTATRSASA
jgi:hypothetical protein